MEVNRLSEVVIFHGREFGDLCKILEECPLEEKKEGEKSKIDRVSAV